MNNTIVKAQIQNLKNCTDAEADETFDKLFDFVCKVTTEESPSEEGVTKMHDFILEEIAGDNEVKQIRVKDNIPNVLLGLMGCAFAGNDQDAFGG